MFSLKRHWSRVLCVVIVVQFFMLSAMAQVTGSISGTVTDPSGAIVPNAAVTLINENTADVRNVTTSDEGRFVFSTILPGTYTVKIEQTGFQTFERKNNVVTANENLGLGELVLTVGQVTEVVTTVAEGATVETENSDLTARLTADQLELISTKGRDITSLLRLIPGTTNEDDVESVGSGFGTDLPFISGQRGRSTVPTIDGLNAGEPSGSNKLSMTINQDAVAEVKVLRNNYAAEYGNNGGAIISITSKGGGKEYKGSAYYFLRNEALNANSFFNNKGGLPRALYRHNIWGFNFGGPLPVPAFGEGGPALLRKKANFFVSLEKPHTIQPTNAIFVVVPTELERRGDFSQSFDASGALRIVSDPVTGQPFPGNIVPSSRWNPSTASFLNVFPLPNVPGLARTATGTQYNFVTQKSTDVPKRSLVLRFDVRPTDSDTVYFKMQWFRSDNVGFGTSGWPGGDTNRWGINSHYLYNDDGWSTNWTHVFSKSIVNEFNFGMRHDSEGFVPVEETLTRVLRSTHNYTAPQLFPENNRLGTIPIVNNWGGVSNAANINWLARWGEIGNDYVKPSFSDNLSWLRGTHSFKFGMYFERMLNGEAAGSNWSGTLNFTNDTGSGWNLAAGNTGHPYANALLGNFRQYTETQFRPHTNIEMRMLQWYAQDQWKVNRRLSLSYGLRWGYHTPYFQRDGTGSSFDTSLYDRANAQRFYVPWCTLASFTVTSRAACPTANRAAVDPARIVNGALLPGTTLVAASLSRSYVPGSGSILNGLQLARDPNTPRGYRQFRSVDWEPRVGFAFDVTGEAKTVVRAMFGVYHTPRAGGGTTGDLTGNPPEQRTFTLNNGNITNIEALAIQVRNNELTLPWGNIRGLELKSHTPEIYNFSIGLQRDLGFGTVIEASYVGSRGRWLGEQRNINAVPDTARFVQCSLLPAGVPCHPENRDPAVDLFPNNSNPTNATTGVRNNEFLRPFPGFGDIQYVTWSGNSKYDSLQVQVNRRYARGFQFGVAYTLSKSFDVSSDDRDGLVFNPSTALGGRDYEAFNYAPSDFDQRHVFTVNYIWDVPFFRTADNGFVRKVLGGWQISGTTSFATGKPKEITVEYSSTTRQISKGQTCPTGSFRAPVITNNVVSTTLDQCVPITDFTGGSTNAVPFVNCDRASGVASQIGVDAAGTPTFIDAGCFSRPTQYGDIGNLGRNYARRPNIFNNDLAFFKNFRWGERRGIQLRWEIYNVFNKVNFSDLDGELNFGLVQINPAAATTPAGQTVPVCSLTNICTAEYRQTNNRFGAATSARSPRVMQASLRINF